MSLLPITSLLLELYFLLLLRVLLFPEGQPHWIAKGRCLRDLELDSSPLPAAADDPSQQGNIFVLPNLWGGYAEDICPMYVVAINVHGLISLGVRWSGCICEGDDDGSFLPHDHSIHTGLSTELFVLERKSLTQYSLKQTSLWVLEPEVASLPYLYE